MPRGVAALGTVKLTVCLCVRILCSIICPHKLSIQRELALHQKRLLFLATGVEKEKQSIVKCFNARKQPFVNFNLFHNIVHIAHSVPRV